MPAFRVKLGANDLNCVGVLLNLLTHCSLLCRIAFVEFETEEAAAAAIEEHNNEEVDGRELHLNPAGEGIKRTPQKSSRLYSLCILSCYLCYRCYVR